MDERAHIDLQEYLGHLGDLLRGTLDSRICICIDVEPGCLPCRADAAALHTALIQLVTNARDAMPQGGTLTLSARRDSIPAPVAGQSRACSAICIRDSGIGMDEVHLAQAQQSHFTTKGRPRGGGLGLNEVQAFAAANGGALCIRSEQGLGTVATLYLPLA